MTIAFLTPEYPHPKVKHAAGIGTSIKNLAEALVKQNVSVIVFIYGQKENLFFEENGINFYLIADRNYLFGKWFFYRKHIQKIVNKIILQEKIDLIEAPDWTGITAFMKFRIPLVIRFHGSDTYFCYLEKRKQKLKNYWFEKIAVYGANAFIAPTTYAGTVSKKLFNIKNKIIKTIHNGLLLDQFHNQNAKIFEKGLLLYIGTIIRKKGVFELPEILKKVRLSNPEARLILIGSDSADVQTGNKSTWKMLEKEFDSNYLENVTYLGKIPYNEVQQYIKRTHVCVFPSFAETLGMVTIESMALQKPVVNTNIGWAQELIVDEQSGYLVHPKDHDTFASKIVTLLNDEEMCLSMGKNAKIRVENIFDIDNIAKQNIEFYNSLVK